MQVQVTTDNNVNGHAKLIENIEADLTDTLSRFGKQITRVEVYLKDANGPKSAANDKQCLLEARVAGLQPIVASHEAESLQLAIDGASDKLLRALEKITGKLGDRKGRMPQGGEPV